MAGGGYTIFIGSTTSPAIQRGTSIWAKASGSGCTDGITRGCDASTRYSAFVLQHVQPGIPIRDVDQSVGGDQDIGGFGCQRDIGTWIDQLLRRRRHPVGD